MTCDRLRTSSAAMESSANCFDLLERDQAIQQFVEAGALTGRAGVSRGGLSQLGEFGNLVSSVDENRGITAIFNIVVHFGISNAVTLRARLL